MEWYVINMARAYRRPLADAIDSACVWKAGKGMDEVVMVTEYTRVILCFWRSFKVPQQTQLNGNSLPSGQVFHNFLDFETFSPFPQNSLFAN